MISVRIKKPKFLTANKKVANDELVSFFCPICDKVISHMLSEFTPMYCPLCNRIAPNIKGLMNHKTLRAAWHFGGKLN